MNYHEFDQIDPTTKAFRTLVRMLALMRLSGYIMACYAILQGFVVIIGGPKRFSAIGYQTALIVPGAPAIWGWVILACGILAFIGIKNRMYAVSMWGMFLGGAWSFAFGGSFLISSIQHENANLTAMVTYGKDGVLFVLMAMVHRMLAHNKQPPEEPDA